MRVHAKDFRVREGNKIDLKEWTTRVDPYYRSKKQYKNILREHITEMSALQNLLYASKSYAVLIIFQGMYSAGKDSAIKHVMCRTNPQRCADKRFTHASI